MKGREAKLLQKNNNAPKGIAVAFRMGGDDAGS
jgi:hypothetical protein